ncbi:hypothetical protein [Achromobacter sp. 413638]|jgi:hypothetical protein|uniref:hypothetical protein n=1 Tax=Achromobacter sp. 413638 TaxID=3342385 RepID=UPI00370A0735
MNAMKQLFSKKRLPWIFVHLLLGMWGGAAHGQLADYVYYNSEGDASDQHGALMIIDKPQAPSEGCGLAGLTYGSYEIRDSNPLRNSQTEWHYQGRMNGYCVSSKSKAFHRGSVLVCDDIYYVSPLAGRQFCETAEKNAAAKVEQLQTNIELGKKLDATNRQLNDALAQIDVLKKCLIAPQICPLTQP